MIIDVYSYVENEFYSEESKLDFEDLFKIMNEAFITYYDEYGAFFRHCHRIIKYILENISDQNIAQNLLGMLRANLSEEMLLLLFYNSCFTNAGLGLGIKLQKLNFFADKNDLVDKTMHFNSSRTLIPKNGTKSVEYDIIQNFFIKDNNKIYATNDDFKKEIKRTYTNFFSKEN